MDIINDQYEAALWLEIWKTTENFHCEDFFAYTHTHMHVSIIYK